LLSYKSYGICLNIANIKNDANRISLSLIHCKDFWKWWDNIQHQRHGFQFMLVYQCKTSRPSVNQSIIYWP